MTIFAKLGFGFGTLMLTFACVGALSAWYLRAQDDADVRARTRVAQNEQALAYRHGAQDVSLGAAQLAAGNVMGEQRIAEGIREMAKSRRALDVQMRTPAEQSELRELARIEHLTVSGTQRVRELVHARSSSELVRQELAFLSARADALNLRLEALSDDTREQMQSSMQLSALLAERVQTHSGIALVACLVFSALVSVVVFRAIAPPLARLEEGVRQIARGELDHHIAVTSQDEIGRLTLAFNDMTAGLKRAMDALDARNRDMRTVLDHVNQGLLTMDASGQVSRERSRVVDSWLGDIPEQSALWDHLAMLDAGFAASFRLNWEQVIEGVMPVELSLDQLPRRLKGKGVELEVEYTPILQDGRVTKLLWVISDIGDRLARERARAHEQEVLAIFQAIQRDKEGFLDFFSEGSVLVAALSRSTKKDDQVLIKRHIHTLKGNAGIFGISSVAATCHELETCMADGLPEDASLSALLERWHELEVVVAKLVGETSTRIEIDDDEYAAILAAIAEGRPRHAIAQLVAQWRMERVQPRLDRFADQARSLAARLGKLPIEVCVKVDVPRLPRLAFAPVWSSLIHALRNAIDHGLETPEERARSGKDAMATLTLRTCLHGDELAIEVEDNGRGIAWSKIAEKARANGLPAQSHEDLVRALFADGISTVDLVTDVSGRGVGMAALRDACARLGGRIHIDSCPGRGTSMSFRFPRSLLAADAGISFAPPACESRAPIAESSVART